MPRLRIGGSPRSAYQRVGLDVGDVIYIQKTLLDARSDFLAAGDAATAARIAVIFDAFVTRIRKIAERTAELAEERIKDRIEATRVRPDTGRGRLKLKNMVRAEAWDPTGNIATGTVVIGIHEFLDRLPYWRAQEWGFRYSHTPKGFFAGPGYGGVFLPNPADFRLHPLFIPSSKGRAFQRAPVIGARHFMRDGTDAAVTYWRAETQAAINQTATQLTRLLRRRGRRLP
jgi:hypothetical protein